MILFDETELFTQGNGGEKIFDLPDTDLMRIDGFFDKAEADHYYKVLYAQTPWRELELEVYDKKHVVPRMVCWYEDKQNFGADPKGHDWTPELLQIRDKVTRQTGIEFNSVLLNLYRDGRDGVGWHSDRVPNFGKHAIIASVSFGQTRIFGFRHKLRSDVPQLNIPLHHGTFLLMGGSTQEFWQHQVPKTAKAVLPRINLTFRQIDRKRFGQP